LIPRSIAALLALSLLIPGSARPLAAQADPTAEGTGYQRVEVPEAGLAASFPVDWKVMTPMARRESEFGHRPEDDTPVYVWTTIFATAGDGSWCDIDLYEDFPMSLGEHVSLLEGWLYGSYLYGRTGGSTPLQLPAGDAWRIDMSDESERRSWTMYMVELGSDRYMLTCVQDLGSQQDWLSIADSITLRPR